MAKSSEDLLAQARSDWRRAYSHWRKWRVDAKEDFAFVAGEQWDTEDKMFLERQGRPAVVFNRVAPMVDAVSGAEVSNRQEVRYIPREMGDVGVNEALTAAAKYFRDQCNAEDEESSAFFDCIVAGVGWTETRIDFDEEADGAIVVERVDPFEVFVDPAARRANFMDAAYVFRVKDLTKEDVEREWPGATDTLMPGSFAWGVTDDEDVDDPHETIHGRQYEIGVGRPGLQRRRKYRVVEYQWKQSSPVYRMIDPDTGNEVEFDARRYSVLKKAFRSMGGDPPPAVTQKRMEVRRAFFLGDQVLEEGRGPCSTAFTYRAITGKHDRNAGTWYGLVRPMKDPQRWSNKFFSQILHIINSNAKGGLLAEADAFENARDAETRWAEADSIVWMRPGGLQKVGPKPISGVPPDVSSMMQFCVTSLREVTGINLELLGMSEQVQPGVLEYQRRQSGLMILATLFDSLRRYRKEQGRLLLYFIQEYIPEGRLIRIQGPTGAQYAPLAKDPVTARYDVIVDEAPSSPNLKEQVFSVLQVLVPNLTQLGIRIPTEALDYLPLPESLVQAIRQANEPQDGQQAPTDPAVQVMQAQIQADQLKAQSDAQLAQAKLQQEQQLKQQELEFDRQIQMSKLQLERERADVEAQVETARLQLEALKMQAMLNKVVPGATPDMQQLVQTVAENHESVQNALVATMQHLKATQGRQDEFANTLSGVMEKMNAPREVVRDADGRVTGMRIANGNGKL